ncbi:MULTISPECIES: ASCH domain-containing protein [unclassified Cryobacterium]|uniref:ASCH domain-containing protein n=1 Tax=unclassified Cryobacterium TaxID=2649013 RepID=UPI00106A9C3D|nr:MULTISPECIES: ASCH domain-containing protein [unclassified Cryobacterium]TFC54704.1 ASCH domain-containing protein [Cryobacterium sp. TMB3-1-2]TFC71522.1 ASCH domain-containing protein [Cryobacterium sp. TMB3-15]TFC72333.1 ASCH domain-containing protein [Cryobacterium sp. TMB3-10]TFD42509.1 ASCH domain-containing protein [Cryobacterium sp. TMB3-12]
MTDAVLLSIRPRFADAILEGSKTHELRRRFPTIEAGTLVYLYASSPTKAIVGSFVCSAVRYDAIADIWSSLKMGLGLVESEFFAYFEGNTSGFAVEASHPSRFTTPVSLNLLRSKIGLEPSQSFRYLRPDVEERILLLSQAN